MRTTITVRNLDPSDKAWVEQEAKRLGLSMEAFIRRLVHEKRREREAAETPSATFAALFGPEHGVDLPFESHAAYRPLDFSDPPGEA